MSKQPFNMRFALVATLAVVLGLLASVTPALAGRPGAATAERPSTDREILVPFEDLHVLLQQQPRRVMLSRAEYEDLLKKAKKTLDRQLPHDALPATASPAVLLSADYTATIRRGRAEIDGTLTVDVLSDGLHAVPLDLGSVGLQDAKLDGSNAPIGYADDGRPTLLVSGIGRHELRLQMVAPLQTTAARQVLQFRLPRPPAVRMRLSVPGDVEIKSGAASLAAGGT
ncbi:MAG: hypothetical protein HQ567_08825, partial [Candidatus Nealsonbacteria bacterium]|nr:hypothetical protein [Candidatus Nealsonbacteria bacterium]